MLDRNTVTTHPHADDPDPRLRVAMQADGASLTVFFDREIGWSGEAPPLEVRLTPAADDRFEPWRLMPNLPLHLRYARGVLAHRRGDVANALHALREAGKTRRGLSDDFLQIVAQRYEALVAEGERYPVKALAAMESVDKSTASRWLSTARRRGLLRKEV